jgi:hypothetical protein
VVFEPVAAQSDHLPFLAAGNTSPWVRDAGLLQS